MQYIRSSASGRVPVQVIYISCFRRILRYSPYDPIHHSALLPCSSFLFVILLLTRSTLVFAASDLFIISQSHAIASGTTKVRGRGRQGNYNSRIIWSSLRVRRSRWALVGRSASCPFVPKHISLIDSSPDLQVHYLCSSCSRKRPQRRAE